jgi:hypothetical protein
VEPEEYSQKQKSSQVVSAGAKSLPALAISSLISRRPLPSLPETMTFFSVGCLPTMPSKAGHRTSDTTSVRARESPSMKS